MQVHMSGNHCITRFFPGIHTASKHFGTGEALTRIFGRLTGGTAFAISGAVKKYRLVHVQTGKSGSKFC